MEDREDPERRNSPQSSTGRIELGSASYKDQESKRGCSISMMRDEGK